MDILIEELLSLILEGGVELSTNKKLSKFIRYPLIFLIILIFIGCIGLIGYVSVLMINENIFISLFFMIIGIILLVSGVIKFRKLYFKKYKK